MKSTALTLVVAILAALVGGFTGAHFAGDRPPTVDFSELEDEIARLSSEIETLRESQSARSLTSGPVDPGTLRRMFNEAKIELREEHEERIAAIEASASDEPVDEIVEAKIEERLERREREARAKKSDELNEWVRAAARKQAASVAKQLSLSDVQTERLTESLADYAAANMQHYTTLKDTSANDDDRLDAIDRIRTNMETLRTDAQGILTNSQYLHFEQIQNEDKGGMSAINSWLDEVTASITGENE